MRLPGARRVPATSRPPLVCASQRSVRLGVGRRIERSLVRRPNHVVAVSEVLRRQLLELGVAPERAHTLHNGVDESRFRADVPGAETRRRHQLEGRVVIGFVGSFAPYHGVDLFLEAAARVAAARPEVTFFLVGGRQGNARYESLRQNAWTTILKLMGPEK